MPKQSLAARAGRWSAQHRKIATFGWVAFVILSIFIGGALGTKHLKNGEAGTGESGRASKLLTREFKQPAGEQVLVQSRTLTAHDPQFRAAVADVARRVSRVPVVQDVRSPLGGGGAVSRDGHSALLSFRVRGDANKAKERIAPVLAATAAAQKAHPKLRIEQAGDASAAKALDKSFADDFSKARTISLPITLFILLIAFGAFVAAGIPLLLAFSGVAATLGLVAIPSHIAAIDPAISEVVLLIGMAVGVDYTLFYLRREREERAAGRSPQAALEAAAATSGRAVLVSGLTVMAAMAGMYLTGDATFSSFATGTIMVVAVAMIASLTVLPAVLSKLGDRVMKGRVPYLARRRAENAEPRVWGAILSRVLKRPLVSALASGAVLVALTVPAFGLHTAQSGLQGLPHNLPITQTLTRIQQAFPGGAQPAQVVVQAPDVTAPAIASALRDLEARAVATRQIRPPFEVSVNPSKTVGVVSLPLAGEGTDATSNRALETLRGTLIPATLGKVEGVRVQVTGMTAGSKDFNDLLSSRAPIVFGFVLTMAFMLLLVTFRSIVIPIKAIVLNLLSVGASYGVLVLVFQKGWGESLLGFKSTGAITAWLPMFLFVILFGLSMDYHVFILSRIREAFDRGATTEDAVGEGIKATAGVVTSAAAVMVAVFAVFATLGALDFKQMGVGLAVAILIDATLVRAVLLPATMKLLGDWNWYLPKRLDWLPHARHEPAPQPAT
jgi:RND superfamily putative drug exporter